MKNTKMIIAIIITFLIFASLLNQAQAANLQDVKDINEIVKHQCSSFGKLCAVRIDMDSLEFNAYTELDNKITLTYGIVQKLDKNELTAITMHEVGHIYFQHAPLLFKLAKNAEWLLTNKSLRHRIEYDADNYAIKYFGDTCQPNYLIKAFKTLNKPNPDHESNTHPSVTNRIKNANSMYKNKCGGM